MTQTILRLPHVCKYTGLPKSSIYRMITEGKFPSPIKLGARSVGWLQADLEAWLDSRIQITRN